MVDIFAAFGLSASAGLNAYIPMLMVAIAGRIGLFNLAPQFEPLTSWWAIGVLVVLSIVEFFVDKVPAADTVNNIISSFVRPAAGALLFAASANVVTDVSPVLAVVCGLLISGGVHTAKTVTRPAVTVTTAGMGNPVVSTAEDVVAGVASLLAILLPGLIALVAVVGIVIFLVWRIRRLNRLERERRAAKQAGGV